MSRYSLICYVNENYENEKWNSTIEFFFQLHKSIFLKKGWEQGFNVKIEGALDVEELYKIKKRLELIIKNHPSTLYDEDLFKKQYKAIAEIEKKSYAIETIYQNCIQLTSEKSNYNFQNNKQENLYSSISRALDEIYLNYYFNNNLEYLEIAKDLFSIASSLNEYSYAHDGKVLDSNGFISHLSHYYGFLYSFSKQKRNEISHKFEEKALIDLEKIKGNYYTKRTEALVALVNNTENTIQNLIEENHLNFYSPNTEKQFKANMNTASSRHALVFNDATFNEYVINDVILCTNRWFLNVFYEKLVLLKIRPIEKYYINYLLGRFKYPNQFR